METKSQIIKNSNLKNEYEYNTDNKVCNPINKELDNLINEIEQEANDGSINKNNNKIIKNNNKNESGFYNLNCNIHSLKILKKYYHIDKITEDENCLFYSLSNIIFNNLDYYVHI